MNSTIQFIIVTYHPNKKVIEAITHALAGQQVNVIDNSKENLGYGAAANKGMKTAFDAGAQWAVIMNQDGQFTRKGISHFCAMAQQCDPGIVGPWVGTLDSKRWTTILNENDTRLHKATPCPSISLSVNRQGSGLREQQYISGSLMAIHKKVWEATGGFYEPYFMYYEDVDYCIRAKKAGFPLMHTSIDGIKHDDNPSFGKGSFLHEYYLARNHLLFVERQAALSVKLYEYLRLPKTFAQAMDNKGKSSGLTDYFFRKFGPY